METAIKTSSGLLNHLPISQRRFNVFALPAGFSGCAFWRLRRPLGKLKEIGSSLDILLADNPDKAIKMEEIQCHAEKADLIAMQAPAHDDGHMLMRMYKAQGKKVVVDYDDYSFDLSPSNPRYRDLGIKECVETDSSGKEIYNWKDQCNGFDLKTNIRKYEGFVRCVKEADLVTTTTDYLADKFRPLNKNVKILPNSIDFNLWQPIPRPAIYKDQIRLGWFGGDSHYDDLGIFQTVIPQILAENKNVVLALQCPPVPSWEKFFKDLPAKQIDWRGWAQLEQYTLFLAARHFDIGLCPLDEKADFNACKSKIKMLEFGALGIPSVCQNMLPYKNEISDGTNCFLASTEEEWYSAISRLVKNSALRQAMGLAAYEYVRKNYDLDVNCRLWEHAYRSLIEGNYGPN